MSKENEQPQQTQGKLSVEEYDFIESALNNYWHDAVISLARKDLGNIEKKNYQSQLDKSKALMQKIDSIGFKQSMEQFNQPELEAQQIQALLDKGYQMAMNEVNSRPQVLSDEDIEKLALLQYPMNLNIINDDENEKLRIGFIRGFKASQSLKGNGFSDWTKAIKEFTDFSVPTFADATQQSSLDKLKDEIKEIEDLINGDITEESMYEIPKEYVDCLMCLFDSAARKNITPEVLLEEFRKKTQVNKNRVWIKNENNTYSHKK